MAFKISKEKICGEDIITLNIPAAVNSCGCEFKEFEISIRLGKMYAYECGGSQIFWGSGSSVSADFPSVREYLKEIVVNTRRVRPASRWTCSMCRSCGEPAYTM